jgi:hypothetical protein
VIDDFQRQIEEDERRDHAELVGKLSPIEYGRLRDIAPQLVYYRIRKGQLELEACPGCGRRVIDVRRADDLFRSVLQKAVQAEEDDAGQSVLFEGGSRT